jgi:hypothetical protein
MDECLHDHGMPPLDSEVWHDRGKNGFDRSIDPDKLMTVTPSEF